MKAKPLIVAVILLAAGAALAGPGRGGPGPDIDKLTTLLDLDEYQAQQVEAIFNEQRDSMRARFDQVRASGERPDHDAMRAQHETIKAEMLAKLGTVLSTEQLEKFEVLAENRRRGGPHRGNPQADEGEAEESE